MMNITEFLVIYFSIGAPFGVYTYFQNRVESNRNGSRLKTLAAFFFWLPAAFRLIRRYEFFDKAVFYFRNKKYSLNFPREKNAFAIQKRLEKLFMRNDSGISIFEFRETLESYAGLTFAGKAETAGEAGNEFFEAAKNKNVELAAKCFYRRNRARLFFHQTSARQDFLRVIDALFAAVSDKRKFVELTFEFVDALEDFAARALLEKIFVDNPLEQKHFAEKKLEKNVWKPQICRLPNADSISTLTHAMTSLPKKD
ncbi:MAG TPA: hypothetical protein VNI84_05615 [Pyrinomonadaceae bacterium]|nr:hypothetical protein [Pyrinomonadaceae bacterium]